MGRERLRECRDKEKILKKKKCFEKLIFLDINFLFILIVINFDVVSFVYI